VAAFVFDIAFAGTETGAPVAAAFFLAGVLAGEGGLPVSFFEPLAEFLAGQESVAFSGAVALHLHLDPAEGMLEKNAGRGFVDLLATAAGAANEFLHQVVLVDPEGGEAASDFLLMIR
jgi:hypothetical protein